VFSPTVHEFVNICRPINRKNPLHRPISIQRHAKSQQLISHTVQSQIRAQVLPLLPGPADRHAHLSEAAPALAQCERRDRGDRGGLPVTCLARADGEERNPETLASSRHPLLRFETPDAKEERKPLRGASTPAPARPPPPRIRTDSRGAGPRRIGSRRLAPRRRLTREFFLRIFRAFFGAHFGGLARGSVLGRGSVGLYEFWMVRGWVIGVWRDGFVFIVHGFDFCFCLFGGSYRVEINVWFHFVMHYQ
jgi:hypothetical protein